VTPVVLVVDDDEAVRTVVEETLRSDGHEVACANDGRMALTRLRCGEVPALMLLDLMMPGMNGWQLLDEMRRDPALESLPVIVLTAFDARDDLPQGCHVLHKPIDADVLLGLVHALLHEDFMQALTPDVRRYYRDVPPSRPSGPPTFQPDVRWPPRHEG
jgi:CheY-like chemotaxis protein